jgi:hypothetical protein
MDLYNREKKYNYAGINYISFVGFKTINGIEHVVMRYTFGTEKKVYKSLYDKYTKEMPNSI